MRAIILILSLMAPLAGAERLLVDTDCGFLGDDGTTLAMLLRSPEKVRVDGITLVSGNVWATQSAIYTREILGLLGKIRTPMYLGAEAPLLHTPAMAEEAHRRWGPIEFRGAFAERPGSAPAKQSRGAVEYLIHSIEAGPGQLTVVALGPMTNLAIALRLRPAIAAKIRRLVFMGGNYRVPGNASPEAEFNFWFDPEAAQAVLRSAIPQKIMFGLDVCNKAMLDKAGFEEIIAARTPLAERFKEDFGVRYPGFLKNPEAKVSLWDSLVSAWLINPALFAPPERLFFDVDTRFGRAYGKVIPLDRKLAPEATPVEMMNDLDYPRVFALFRDLLMRRR
jgi:inosine-uridine nucleoside N-ribohydrolase